MKDSSVFVIFLLTILFVVDIRYSQAQEIAVASTSITNANTVTYTARGVAQTISITLGLTDTDGSGGTGLGNTVSKISVYFTDNAEYENSQTESTAVEKTFTPAKAVPADATNDKTTIAGETVDLLIDVDKCKAYTHVCIVITAGTGNTVTTDDDGCLPFGSTVGTGAGAHVCPAPGILASSFTSTAPASYKINTETAVDFTFSIGLINTDPAKVDVTGINVYLSDDESLTKKSKEFTGTGLTFPVEVNAKADGSTLTPNLKASVVADEAQCSEYKFICAQLAPGNAIGCTADISSNIDCSASSGTTTAESTTAGSSVKKGALGILFFLSAVVAVTVFVPGRN